MSKAQEQQMRRELGMELIAAHQSLPPLMPQPTTHSAQQLPVLSQKLRSKKSHSA